MRLSTVLLAGSLAAAGAAQAAAPTPEQLAFFEGKVRPLLASKCYKCHSVEQGKAKGGLTLDTKDGLLKGGDSGPGVKPGHPDNSVLIKAILYTDADLQMPPKGEKLSDQEIADLTTWVKMGAPDPRLKAKGAKLSGLTSESKAHWAFQPVVKPELPKVKNASWAWTPVDLFIMEKLEEKGMSPSPNAPKDTLLRRATYDLTGLPPTLDEIYAFRADQTPQAFAKVVDRLLASPAYGERWGRYWLDTARYADTTGERNNNNGQDYRFPYAYTFRDWVIKAFNSDLPYDQFVTQQLAADKIPKNSVDNQAALGFLTVGPKARNKEEVIDDQINVVSKGFVGLTVACARCHDHMFDPIPTKDYYALHGVFQSTIEPQDVEKPVLNKVDPKLKAEFEAKVREIEKKNQGLYYKLISDHAAMFRAKAGYYIQAAWGRRNGAPQAEQQQADKLVLEQKLDVPLLNELRKFAKPGNPMFGPLIELLSAGNTLEATAAGFASGTNNGIHPIIAAGFKGQKIKTVNDAVLAYNNIFSGLNDKAKGLLDAYAGINGASASSIDSEMSQFALAPFNVLPASELDTEGLRNAIQKFPLQLRGKARIDFARVNELKMTNKGVEALAMVVADAPNPSDSPVYIRGQKEVRGEMVPRSFLELFSGGKRKPFKDGSGRLELAQAIASKSNPLTARVMVNRVWLHHFGQGFVRTPDDLGSRSETPSHQELLDYLSAYFMEQNWSIKALHKLIMLSRVYQESSYTVPAHEVIDPENRLLWRANVRRLDFESFRDSLLVMSKQLDKSLGGQPVNLTDEPYSYRRSVYGYIDRGNVPELLQNFDFADPTMPNSSRTSTIVPQQALFLMNSPMAVDVARHVMARQEVVESPAGADFYKVQKIYEIVYQRAPSPYEIKLAMSFVSNEAAKQPAMLKTMKELTEKAQQKAEKKVETMENLSNATKAIQNEGEVIERRALSPWETYTQALLLANEAAYVN